MLTPVFITVLAVPMERVLLLGINTGVNISPFVL
jgi:hypothetical protein